MLRGHCPQTKQVFQQENLALYRGDRTNARKSDDDAGCMIQNESVLGVAKWLHILY